LEQREKPLLFPHVANRIVDFADDILNIIQKALHPDTEQRFQSATKFLQALNGELEITDTGANPRVRSENEISKKGDCGLRRNDGVNKKATGFVAIAGMQELKNMLQTDVIDEIRNPEEYRRHGLGLPGGMLL
jgi:transitional endoplasmic reticulum ATPase